MAKKKTAGPDNTTAAAAAPRRRPPTKRSDATIAESSAISETFDAGSSVAAADDRATSAPGGSDVSSGNGHSAESPSYEQIAEAAYQRYLSRGGQHGSDFDDWLEAERELRTRR